MEGMKDFKVILLGVIYDPKMKKILIGKRENDPYFPKLSWVFPGGRLNEGEDVGVALKKRIKETTGLEIGNLGSIFTKTFPDKKDFVAVHFLCEVRKGKIKEGKKIKNLKWVKPEALEKHFTTSFHPRLKEYILNLK